MRHNQLNHAIEAYPAAWRLRAVGAVAAVVLALSGEDCQGDPNSEAKNPQAQVQTTPSAQPGGQRSPGKKSEPNTERDTERTTCKGIIFTDHGETTTWAPDLSGPTPQGYWLEGRINFGLSTSRKSYNYDTRKMENRQTLVEDAKANGVTMRVIWHRGPHIAARECASWNEIDRLRD